MKVLLEAPEGFKRKILEIAEQIEKEGNEVIISGESFYGSCDLREHEAVALKCDKIIHIGHNQFMKSEFPVEYREFKVDISVLPILESNFSKIEKFKSIGLLSSVQFIDSLPKIKALLEERGKNVFIGKGRNDGRVLYDGQILGCDLTPALAVKDKVDCFIFVGSGKFHALGADLKTDKPIFILDVEKKEVKLMENQKFLRQRYAAIALAKDAKTFGVLVSTKRGQMNAKGAELIKKRLELKGKKAFIIAFDEIKPEKLEGLGLDCLINTACPRIAVEDRTSFKQPILNLDELEEVFK